MLNYDHKAIEKKWQAVWEKEKPWSAKEDLKRKKFYALIEFPYPSGDGLHTGHIRSNTAMDIIARKRRREGYLVLYPIGWDAFGLPTENYAIKTGRQPADITKENCDTFRRQLKSLGFSFDWEREITTSDPAYYKWTQWIFLKLLEHGLAYKAKMPINWCLSCKIGLANEEVVDDKCERCGGKTEKRDKEQWMLAITKYADRLHFDLDTVDYPEHIKTQQRNWIGRNEVDGKVTYKLRDWVFSRQRYWGEPIPVVYCLGCGIVPLEESELPLTLPQVEKYQPTDSGESPLAAIEDWVNTVCPTCGGPAKRETDTMPNWAGSSWYYLAYTMQGISNFEFPISNYQDAFKYWTPVDWYNGGMEHTTLHLLYSRFWHKFLYDIHVVPTIEPYHKRTSHGLILAVDGSKMSKSKGNTVSPDPLIEQFGADTLRIYEMFMGPFDQAIAWNTDSLVGAYRFLERVIALSEKISEDASDLNINTLLNNTIDKVSRDIESMKFNTAVSSLMILTNAFTSSGRMSNAEYQIILQLLAPFAPHITEELWHACGYPESIHDSSWPVVDSEMKEVEELSIMLQINGKVRGSLTIDPTDSEDHIAHKALQDKVVIKWLEGAPHKRVVYIKNRLINIVS